MFPIRPEISSFLALGPFSGGLFGPMTAVIVPLAGYSHDQCSCHQRIGRPGPRPRRRPLFGVLRLNAGPIAAQVNVLARIRVLLGTALKIGVPMDRVPLW